MPQRTGVLTIGFSWGGETGARGSRGVGRGMWQPAAVARPVALKQCLALPKPLWHEVMKPIGGDCAELSKFEFMRRDDLKEEDDVDPDEDEDEDEKESK